MASPYSVHHAPPPATHHDPRVDIARSGGMMRSAYIVEDDDAVRASLQSLLSTSRAMMVRTFPSGDAFVGEMEELDPGVVLLDVNMPGRSGLDVLGELRGRNRHFKAIILTGQGNTGMAVQSMKLGAVDFLEKPYDRHSLLSVVDQAFTQLEEAESAARRVQAAKDLIGRLSAREVEVLTGLIAGRPNKVIAFDLDISPRTVEIYRANLMTKLGVRSLSEALRIAFAAGLVQ